MSVAKTLRGLLFVVACCAFAVGDVGAASRVAGVVTFKGTVSRSCSLTVQASGDTAAIGVTSIGSNTVTGNARIKFPAPRMVVKDGSADFTGQLTGSEPTVVTCS